MNQFQNINVQVHLPGQGQVPNPMPSSGANQGANPLFMYPNFPFAGQN